MKQHCPVCASPCCLPSGHSKDLLIISEFPGKLEIETGIPFSTHHRYITAGKVFREELKRVGMSLNDFRVANIWIHEPNKSEDCWKVGYDMVLDEAKGKKAILLVGSDTVETFTNYKVSDVSGLQVDSSILSAPIIYATVNPALALHRAHGEVRIGIEKFVKRLEKENLI
jgi:uracil-DNA glycosylase